MSELLKKLNNAQKKAVTHLNDPLLVVAGAGTGKTTALINRLAYLVLDKKIATDDILLLTFTEKAAGEMEERADKILPYGYTDLWISTFHSFCERILREHALEIGLDPNFKLLSQTDGWVLVKQNLENFNLNHYKPLGNPTKFISELLKHFSRLKDENISPDEYLKYAEELDANQDQKLGGDKKILKNKDKKSFKNKKENNTDVDFEDAEEINRIKELAESYHTYNQLLLDNSLLDFGDLIIYTIKLFKKRKKVLNYYREKFKYIMVDEFQDTNLSQYELVKILAAPKNNLMVVGDDDQAIYKFRGASISNIMQFKEDFPQAKEVVLIDNYRSRQEILDKSHEFIKHNNPNRLEDKLKINKKLKARNNDFLKDNSLAVRFFNFPTADEEVAFVVKQIEELYWEKNKDKEPINWSDFAILVRANDTAEAYVKELNRQGIPNQFMSWRGLYYKPIILDSLAYLRLLNNYHDSSSLFRVLNMESFKVDHGDLVTINKVARRKVWTLYEALKNVNSIPEVSKKTVANITKLLKLLDEHSNLSSEVSPTKIFLHFAYDSGLLKNLDRDRDIEQFSYLNQFYKKIKDIEESGADIKLKDFLEAIDLELEAGETGSLKLDFTDSEAVKIMTVHGAKGLEFRYVFIVNLVDKKFPTISRNEKITIPEKLLKEKITVSKEAHLEEERRLFYVASTRAKEVLYLTSARDYGGAREKKPSRFVSEIGINPESKEEVVVKNTENEFIKDLKNIKEGDNKNNYEKDIKEKYPLPAKFSFSQLAAFSTCPLQYKFAFVLKIPAPSDKSALIFGRVLHNTLYNFLLPIASKAKTMQTSLFNEEKSREDLINEKRLFEVYEDYWQNDGYKTKEERSEYYKKGKKALKDFLVEYKNNPPKEVVFLEKNFSFKIGSDVIKGTIDRVDRLENGELEVVDYKTGSAKDKLDFKQKRQLILYQLFLEEHFREKVGKLSYYYLETGDKLSFTASDKDKEKLKEGVLKEIKAIKERDFTPTPSPMCRFCDFNNICEFRQV